MIFNCINNREPSTIMGISAKKMGIQELYMGDIVGYIYIVCLLGLSDKGNFRIDP